MYTKLVQNTYTQYELITQKLKAAGSSTQTATLSQRPPSVRPSPAGLEVKRQ